MNPTSFAFIGYILWMMLLIFLILGLRIYQFLFAGHPVNTFKPDGSDVSDFSQRLCRAHANCIEGFPIFGGLLLFALISGLTTVTNGLAAFLLLARVCQSTIHLISTRSIAVHLRFTCLMVQLIISAIWGYQFLMIHLS